MPLPVAVDLHADVLGVPHDCSLDEALLFTGKIISTGYSSRCEAGGALSSLDPGKIIIDRLLVFHRKMMLGT